MDIVKGAVVIMYRNSKDNVPEFLLLQHKNSLWTFVGGRIEDTDNTIESGLQREIIEELGLPSSKYKLTDTGVANEFIYGNEKPDRAGKHGITYYYVGTLDFDAAPRVQAEIVDLKWLAKDQVLSYLAFDDIKSKFLEVCAKQNL